MLGLRLIGLCWVIFLLYWVVNFWRNKRTVERPNFGTWALHRFPLGIGAWMLFVSPAVARLQPGSPWSTPLVPHAPVVEAVAVMLCVLGVAGAIWARRTLAGNWSGDLVFKEKHELVERGPYGYVRHPIYTSMILMAFRTALAYGWLLSWAGFVVMTVGFLIRAKQEEALMLAHFPGDYAEYKTRVKTLIPFLW